MRSVRIDTCRRSLNKYRANPFLYSSHRFDIDNQEYFYWFITIADEDFQRICVSIIMQIATPIFGWVLFIDGNFGRTLKKDHLCQP